MKTEKQLNSEILEITMKIQDQFPELSKYIAEMPITIPKTVNKLLSLLACSACIADFSVLSKNDKKLAVNSAANEILSKEKMESQLKNIKSEAEFVKNSLNKLAESTEKK